MDFREEIEQFCAVKCQYEYSTKKITSLGVGGLATFYAEPDTLYSLNFLASTAKKYKIPHKIVGNGTNLLISDSGYNGIIISTKNLKDVFFVREKVRAMAGANLSKVISFALEHNLSGLESLSGIPATVGGAVVMNAGAFGKTISDCVVEIETLSNGRIKKYDTNQCAFGYRTSRFKKNGETVVSATFSFSKEDKEKIKRQIENINLMRKAHHPEGRSCGSVFLNPKPNSAGALIERANLKGLSIGGAKVSEKHGNFIITNQTATANDVRQLILHIKDKIFSVFGITLKEEVEYVGEF